MADMNQQHTEHHDDQRIIALASLASLFGNQIEHYGRLELQITFKGDTEHDWWFPQDTGLSDEELDEELGIDPDADMQPLEPDDPHKLIREPENPSALVAQILTMLHPKVKAVFGSSAIYPMLSVAAGAYGREGNSVEEKINGMSFPLAAQAWIITKRIFATNHLEDMRKMIDLLMWSDDKSKAIMDAGKPLVFSEMTNEDRRQIIEYCQFILAQNVDDINTPESQSLAPFDILSQISASGKIMLPASKAFRQQRELASSGARGELNVGHGAIVNARITAPDGKSPIVLSLFEINIEAAVGQLFQENGFRELHLSPAQIYRSYARLPSDATVSPAEIKQTIEAMDKLIATPASLDFTEQIEKHTRMKRREGFDYTKAERRGTLITGVHDLTPVKTHNGYVIQDSFTIHQMPMFYAYSYAIGQIYTLPDNLLTGDAPADPSAKKTKKKKSSDNPPIRRSIDDINLRRYLLGYIEFQKGEWEKAQSKLKNKGKPIPPFFEFFLPFDTIAEYVLKGNAAAMKRADVAQLKAARKKAEEGNADPSTTAAISQEPKNETFTPKQLRTLREQTYDFMLLQVKLGNITSCDYYKKGRALHGIKVRL